MADVMRLVEVIEPEATALGFDLVRVKLSGQGEDRTLQVMAGKVTPLKLEMPQGTLSLNAQPWAEVWLDGERVGETPIGNLSVSIGSHSVLFRHPEFGERHSTALVTAKGPVRVSVDMRKPQ